ncbi:MAG: hypothetical protein ABIS50_19395 [Luteolibacter sp.]
MVLMAALNVAAQQGTAPPSAAAGPTEVTVGTYVNQIYAMNLKENVFTVDFYIWFRWKGNTVNPIETFELMNGKIEEKKLVPTRDIGDEHYAQARITAVINKFWDVSRFPLDSHDLTIFIEDQDNDITRLRYVADAQNTGFDKDLKVLGYKVTGSQPSITDNHYNTNYGDISLPVGNESIYSRYGYAVLASRAGYSYFLKLFSTIFISAMVGFLAFLVKPVDLDPRFGLGVGALFAVVASTFIISSELPDSDRMTMADRINTASMVMIFLSLIQSAIALKIYERSENGRLTANRLDSICIAAFPMVYCLWILCIVLTR